MDEQKKEVANKLGVDPERLTKRNMTIPDSLREDLKSGKVKLVHKGKQGVPDAFVPQPSPQEVMEQTYARAVERIEEAKSIEAGNKEGLRLPPLPAGKQALTSTKRVPKRKVSEYMSRDNRLGRMALCARPPDAPSILEECEAPIRLHISQHQSPGDIVMLTAAIRDLHMSYPGKFITDMRTPCIEIWDNNPYHMPMPDDEPNAMWVPLSYPLINESNEMPYHFIHAFRKELEGILGLPIKQGAFKGDLHLSHEEKQWASRVYEAVGYNAPYWVINAGHKDDFTCKMWEFDRYQQIVNEYPDILFAQVGDAAHNHKPLKGANVVDLVGKTDIRQLIRLVHHAAGVITPVSFAMHLAAAVEVNPRFKRRTRPCIVIAGGREPAQWEAYTNHQYLHTCGMLPCCDKGGCWKSRVMPLGDGDEKDTNSLCSRPIISKSGQIIPQCMAMIPVEEVMDKIDNYLEQYEYLGVEKDWKVKPSRKG